jgi:hypothetical protein
MPTQLVSLSPSAFVARLIQPGLATRSRPVALARYVSSGQHNPLAAAVHAQLNQLMSGQLAAPDGQSAALADLRQLRQDVLAAPGAARDTAWRRVFTGHGVPAHLVAVWNFILSHRSLLQALPGFHESREPDSAAVDVSWSTWFATGDPIRAMVADAVFGYDCLGYVGNYLYAAGLEPAFPERSVAQYTWMMGLRPVTSLTELHALAFLLWPGGAGHTQHIAIVDRVHLLTHNERGRDRVLVDICQSSSGGPQCNQRVMLAPTSGRVHVHGQSLPAYRIVDGGSPSAPVRGTFTLMQHSDWLLARMPG